MAAIRVLGFFLDCSEPGLSEGTLEDSLQLLSRVESSVLKELVRSQEDLKLTLSDAPEAHVHHDVVNEHLLSDSLHVSIVFHEKHVKVHVDLLEFSIGKGLRDLDNDIVVHALVLHNTDSLAFKGHLSDLFGIVHPKSDADSACLGRVLIH